MTDAPASSRVERYGRPARWRRVAVVVGSGVVGVLGLAWLAWTAFFHATPEVSSELVGWEVVDDHAVTARIDVVIRGDGTAADVGASCLVRAIATDHVVVGEATYVPEEGRNVVALRTERPATSVENVGCTTPSQHRPR